MNLLSRLFHSKMMYPQKTAIICPEGKKTYKYKELCEQISIYASFFAHYGIRKGDRVGIKLQNSPEWIIVFYSILALEAVPVLIDIRSVGRETLQLLNISDTQYIICHAGGKNWNDDLLLIQKKLKKVFLFNPEELSFDNPEIISINESLLNHFEKSKESTFTSIQDTQIILFAYRDYGFPLAVLFDEKALMKSVKSNIHLTEVDENLCIPNLLPASHIFALTCSILVPLSVGATIIPIYNALPTQILNIFEEYSVNFINTVPTLIKVLLHLMKKSKFNLRNLKKGIVGGDTFSEELFYEWKDVVGGELMQGYGLTETCPVLCNHWRDYNPLTIGKPMDGVSVKIIDEHGNTCSDNKEGRLIVKSGTLMKGYLNAKEKSYQTIKNGWIDTGDSAFRDGDGFIHFVKRLKRIAKIGGNTVDLVELESILNQHPSIREVSISVVDDKLWQDRISCKIKGNQSITRKDILAFCKKNMASFKIPRDINILTD